MTETLARVETRGDRVNRQLFRAGWKLGPHLPDVVRSGIISGGSRLAMRHRPAYLDTYRRNLEAALGRKVGDDLIRRGVASYLRTWTEVLALPGWSPDKVLTTVVAEEKGRRVLDDAAAGPGVVVALPHMGNWDLAGAWACLRGLPVSTVAERLAAPEYEAFTSFREGLGMRVLAHDDPAAPAELISDLGRGRIVCLVADRDLMGAGVPVDWPTPVAPRPVRMPAGPALVARRAGAVLLGAACRYEGRQMRIDFSEPIETRPGRDGLIAMTQQLAGFFSMRVQRRPEDWHLMQPFFREPAR